MKLISLEATSDLLATATITNTVDFGHLIAHAGIAADGSTFVLVNGTDGQSIIINL